MKLQSNHNTIISSNAVQYLKLIPSGIVFIREGTTRNVALTTGATVLIDGNPLKASTFG